LKRKEEKVVKQFQLYREFQCDILDHRCQHAISIQFERKTKSPKEKKKKPFYKYLQWLDRICQRKVLEQIELPKKTIDSFQSTAKEHNDRDTSDDLPTPPSPRRQIFSSSFEFIENNQFKYISHVFIRLFSFD